MKNKHLLFIGKHTLAFATLALAIGSLSSCSDDVTTNGPENQDRLPEQIIEAIGYNVISDPNILAQYVTNYSTGPRSRTTAEDAAFDMPELPDFAAEDVTTLSAESDLSAFANGNDPGIYYIPAGTTIEANWMTLNNPNLKLYVAGTLNAQGINYSGNGGKIYILAGGKVKSGNEPCLMTSGCGLYVYAGGVRDFNFSSMNTDAAELYFEGDLNYEGNLNVSGKLYCGGAINVNGQLSTNNCNIKAKALNIDGNYYNSNDRGVQVQYNIYINSNFDINCQATYSAKCLEVAGNLNIYNPATLSIDSYIKAAAITCNTQAHIYMAGDALIDAGEKLELQNSGWSIDVNNTDATWAVIKADNIIGQLQENKYINLMAITGYVDIQTPKVNYNDYDAETNYIATQATVAVNSGVAIDAKDESCKPSSTPKIAPIDDDPLPPVIPEVITEITGSHDHDISATCIDIYNGKGYISWHKRGTAIHGCIEAVEINGDKGTITSWMETDDNTVEGGDNQTGNASINFDAGNQGEYDFNHLIVVNEGGTNYVVTVGDNEKKGGFVGAIALDASGDFGQNGSAVQTFVARQIMPTTDTNIGRSGNCVVYNPTKPQLLIAARCGYQLYDGAIADLGVKVPASKNSSLDDYKWKVKMNTSFAQTAGSAKHIATNGTVVATLEYTESVSLPDNDDYWFNDNTTALPARLTVRNLNTWLDDIIGNNELWHVDIPAFAPIYGKDGVVVDNDGKVYVCEGTNGLKIYTNGSEQSWSIGQYSEKLGRKYAAAAANAVYVDSKYIYIAYGAAGLWVLDKNTLTPVSFYTKGGGSANYVKADDNGNIWVAYGRAGVKVLRLAL